MNSTDAANLARNGGVKELLLSHLSNYGDNRLLLNNAKKYYKGKISLAVTGWQNSL